MIGMLRAFVDGSAGAENIRQLDVPVNTMCLALHFDRGE
jgi:hypothetical protein